MSHLIKDLLSFSHERFNGSVPDDKMLNNMLRDFMFIRYGGYIRGMFALLLLARYMKRLDHLVLKRSPDSDPTKNTEGLENH